jgi:FAD/FMN-containing dehydrogenase
MARKWVTGLQAVTLSGQVLELNQDLEKNNTGYDLLQLLIGSEGTLAVLTEATLKLTKISPHTTVLFFSVANLDAVVNLFGKFRFGPFEIQAFEFFSLKCLKAVQNVLKRNCRFRKESPYYVVVEIAHSATAETKDSIETWLSHIFEEALVEEGMKGVSTEERNEIWAFREGITESLSHMGPIRKYDVSVPLRRIAEFLTAIETLITKNKFRIELYLFGHMGDGSPHLNLLKPEGVSLADFDRDCGLFELELFAHLKKIGGSVSAEHGVGILKKNWVLYSRSSEEIRIYRAIKQAFDPMGLLNPGKLIDIT